jgi:hypothetical protein
MRVLSILIMMFLVGCSPYRSSFDCPMADNKAKCQRVSKIAQDVERDLKAESQNDDRISYVRV